MVLYSGHNFAWQTRPCWRNIIEARFAAGSVQKGFGKKKLTEMLSSLWWKKKREGSLSAGSAGFRQALAKEKRWFSHFMRPGLLQRWLNISLRQEKTIRCDGRPLKEKIQTKIQTAGCYGKRTRQFLCKWRSWNYGGLECRLRCSYRRPYWLPVGVRSNHFFTDADKIKQ